MSNAIQGIVARFFFSAAIVAAIVLLFFRRVNPTTAGFTLLLAVLIVSAAWGLRYAIFMALLATFCFNYFFLPPLLRVTISDPHNWVALFAFVFTAVVASELAEKARREAWLARERRRELEQLYDFSQHLLATDNIAELLNAIPRFVTETFGAGVAGMLLLAKRKVYYSDVAAQALLDRQALESVVGRGDSVIDSQRAIAIVPLRMGIRPLGSLGMIGGNFSRQTLEAIASLVAIAIERAGALEQLTRTEAVREGERLRSALMDAVTHEFRTPLTSIKASAESLLAGFQLDDAQRRDLLTVINEESDRLNRLIEEAIEMAQLDAGDVHLEFGAHRIQQVLDAALAECQTALAGHPLEVILPPNLPPARMDFERIAEVLAQLLDNAAKYSPPGSPICVSAEITDGNLTTSVSDQGAGIDSFEQTLIFDKFYRSSNQRRTVAGTGMGLAIAKAIVEAHGGTIGVISQPGHGSVFHFSLPVR